MSANPADLLKLNQGSLSPGSEANLVLVDPERRWTIQPKDFFSKGKNTPFAGQTVTGKVLTTFYKGDIVYDGKKREWRP